MLEYFLKFILKVFYQNIKVCQISLKRGFLFEKKWRPALKEYLRGRLRVDVLNIKLLSLLGITDGLVCGSATFFFLYHFPVSVSFRDYAAAVVYSHGNRIVFSRMSRDFFCTHWFSPPAN